VSPTAETTRRRFLQWILGFSVVATVVGVITPIIGYLWPPEQVAGATGGRTLVGTTQEVSLGKGKVVPVNNKPVIVVNTRAGGVKAFSAICTHLGCIVYWDEARQIIVSPCHDGRFNPVTGNVISGPPPRPLPPYEFTVEEGKIYVGSPLGPLYG